MKAAISQFVTRLAEMLFGKSAPSAGEGLETTFQHTWPWPPWVTLLLLIAAAAFVIFTYLRERGGAGPLMRAALVAIRLALVGLVVLMMYGWMRHRHRTDLPDLVVIVDDSQSMALTDHYDDGKTGAALLRRITAAGFDDATRQNLAKTLLLENDADLLQTLERKYNVKLYALGSSARVQTAADGTLTQVVKGLSAEQPSSRLGKGLRDVLESQRGRPTAAIILLTDGITTEGEPISEVASYARRKAVPLFLVGLGNDQSPRDVRLSDLLVDEVVFAGDLVNFDFKLTGSGYQGREVAVRLRQEESSAILAETKSVIDKDGVSKSVRLSHRPQQVGDFHFVVEVEPLDGEANTDNNRQTRLVSVRDETIRVLFVQEYPSFEFKFLKNAISRGLRRDGDIGAKSIELTTVLQEADLEYSSLDETAQRVFPVSRDELFTYDVLIFGDVNRAFLSHSVMTNIAEFVTERGGGLILIAGPRHTPLAYRDTPLETLMPIVLATASVPNREAVLDQPFVVQPTPLGVVSPQMQLAGTPEESLGIWRNLPGLYWMLEAPNLRAGARVLAEHPTRTGNTGQKLPVICMQFVGAGKVIFHSIDSSYRWSGYPQQKDCFSRYWIQTIRYLSRSKLLGQSRSAEMTSDREEYRRGEPVRLRVRFFDDRRAPPQDDGVTVVLEQEGSTKRQIKLRRDATNRGIFEGTVSNLGDGRYRAWVATPTLDGKPPSRRFNVVAPPGEQARLEMDAADLQRSAEVSQGRFYTFADARDLVGDLPRGRQVRIESLPPTPIWNYWAFAASFVVLIVTEWILRKRAGML